MGSGKFNWKQYIQFGGISGLVIIIFGLLTYFFIVLFFGFVGLPYQASVSTSRLSLFVCANIVTGVALLSVFVIGGGLEVLRGAAAKRVAGFGAKVTIYSALFLGILGVVNYISYRHDFLHYDSTEQKVYTLAPQTLTILKSLEHPVIIRAFYLGGHLNPEARDLLNRMVKTSDKVAWKLIDPEKDPTSAEKFGINQPGTLHFTYDLAGSNRESKITRDVTEQEIVDALQKLNRGGAKIVYYLGGHGEPDITNNMESGYLFLKESIEGENLEVKELVFAGEQAAQGIPADAAALLVIAPRRHLLKTETKAIEAYLKKGGNALLLNEPNTIDDIAKLVKPLGLEIGNDVVVDQVVRLFAGPGLGVQPRVTTYGTHPVTKDFKEGIIFSIVSSVRKSPSVPAEGKVTELAMTSPNSWAERNIDLIFSDNPKAELNDEDINGPVSVAAAFEGPAYRDSKQEAGGNSSSSERAEEEKIVKQEMSKKEGTEEKSNSISLKQDEQQKSRVVVIGDADFVANVNIKQLFNRDFFLNALNWVVGEPEGVTIRARTLRQSTKVLTAEQFGAIFLFTALLLPEALLLIGFAVWWFRKR